MSLFIGPVSGALAAGGLYYGFRTMIKTSTEKHRADLHALSTRLADASASITAPLPAVQRIEHHPLSQMLKSQWNAQVESFVRGAGDLGRSAAGWGKRTLYGGYIETKKD